MVYQRIPCAIQPDPVVYLYYIQEFASANPELPIHASPAPTRMATTSLFCVCESVFCFMDKFACVIF